MQGNILIQLVIGHLSHALWLGVVSFGRDETWILSLNFLAGA